MSVGEHLDELRSRVIRSLLYLAVAFVVCLIFNDRIMGFVLRQPLLVLQDLGYEDPHFQVLSPTESFVTWLKLALVCALVIASPLIARELWRFISAGLYPHERKYIELFGPVSYVLFLGGVAFLYFAVMPTALGFLLDFGMLDTVPGWEAEEIPADPAPTEERPAEGVPAKEKPAGEASSEEEPGEEAPAEEKPAEEKPARQKAVRAIPQLSKFVSLYITMSLLMGLVFQLPLFMLFFMAIGMVQPGTFSKYRRHFVVGAVAALAVLSPTGDAPTLILISLPVIVLYEAGILLGRVLLKRRKKS
ncbi:MAG: twin-arginine translocase subunit TatC [Planctomycetota bacterium]